MESMKYAKFHHLKTNSFENDDISDLYWTEPIISSSGTHVFSLLLIFYSISIYFIVSQKSKAGARQELPLNATGM